MQTETPMAMSYQEKAGALNALSPIAINCRGPNNWYVSQSVEVADGRFLVGEYGNGRTPQDAVEDHWRVLVEDLKPDKYLVVGASTDKRRAARWNGFMWATVTEKG